ncbi:hypothetical protein [Hymenobacter sp. AT01-02]|uniref:hypothetical protein n=1 Tax=Hymenobacter sp. AT01-02 TaxID=1571877 RepID=UPI0005F1771A|nr:hypothetical protein [Hymenobacter sp. AT01-02]
MISTCNHVVPGDGSYRLSFRSWSGTAYAPLQPLGYDYQDVIVNTNTRLVVQLAPVADLR